MAAKDIIHEAVKNALIKDGWVITHDPYTIEYEGEFAYADLAAERPFAAERAGMKIIVEAKSFVGRSVIEDFKVALGQYMLYLPLLTFSAPDHKLYLAVSTITYETDLQRKMIQFVMQRDKLPLIVVDIAVEEIREWIN
jgi:hypothetical protein